MEQVLALEQELGLAWVLASELVWVLASELASVLAWELA
jgi:hypothetical protein